MIEGPIKHPSSSTPGATPTSATQATLLDTSTRAIEEGELLVNQADARLFMKTVPDGIVYDLTRHGIRKNNAGTYVSYARNGDSLSTRTLVAGTTFLIPFTPEFTFTASALAFNVVIAGAGGSTVDIGLFEADPTNNLLPKNAPIYFNNAMDTSTVGTKEFTLPQPFVFTQSKPMWFAMRSDSTAQVRAIATSGFIPVAWNIGSGGQSPVSTMPAAGIGGGGTGAVPGSTGNWFNISLWSHIGATTGTLPIVAPKI